nr:hypothetical protein [Massilia sp. Dwa41.01b]
MREDHHALAPGREQQGALIAVVEGVHRHLVGADRQFAGAAQLRVLQRHLAGFFQQARQVAARDSDGVMLEGAVRVAPEGHFRRLVEHHANQFVAPIELVFVGDAAQAALQAEPVFALFVVEDEVLAQHVARERDGEQVARQRRQAGRQDQRVGLRQIELEAVDPPEIIPAETAIGDERADAQHTGNQDLTDFSLIHGQPLYASFLVVMENWRKRNVGRMGQRGCRRLPRRRKGRSFRDNFTDAAQIRSGTRVFRHGGVRMREIVQRRGARPGRAKRKSAAQSLFGSGTLRKLFFTLVGNLPPPGRRDGAACNRRPRPILTTP